MIACPQCGTQNEDGSMFCDNCGAQLPQPGVVPSPGSAAPARQGLPQAAPAPPAGVPSAPPMAGGTPASACAVCNTPLPPGAAFCDNCGAPVQAGGPASQPPVQPPAQPYQPPAQPYQPPAQQYQPPVQQPQPPVQPVAYGAAPRLVVQASGAQITLPPGKTEYLVGREDAVSNSFPEVDLGLHGGDEGGVSRSHARLYQQGGQWYVQDLNSVNFTFVNTQKVLPNTPVPVPEGAELRFGRVKLTFHVQ